MWPRRHRLLRSETLPRHTTVGTEQDVLRLVNSLLDETQQLIFSREHHMRADMIRDYVAVLIGGIQSTSAKLMTLLLLMGHNLPQPYAQSTPESQARAMGRNYAEDVMRAINASFASAPVQELGTNAYGVSEAAQLMPTLSPAALQAMTFLEDADYVLEPEQ